MYIDFNLSCKHFSKFVSKQHSASTLTRSFFTVQKDSALELSTCKMKSFVYQTFQQVYGVKFLLVCSLDSLLRNISFWNILQILSTCFWRLDVWKSMNGKWSLCKRLDYFDTNLCWVLLLTQLKTKQTTLFKGLCCPLLAPRDLWKLYHVVIFTRRKVCSTVEQHQKPTGLLTPAS